MNTEKLYVPDIKSGRMFSPDGKSEKISASWEEIPDGAFACRGVERLDLPAAIKRIGNNAFAETLLFERRYCLKKV